MATERLGVVAEYRRLDDTGGPQDAAWHAGITWRFKRGKRDAMKNWILLPLLVIAGCDLLEPVSCDTVGLPGLVIEVTDSISTLPVPGRYSVIARAGTYVDSVSLPPTINDSVYYGAFALAYERAGRYNVEVLAPGYRVWNRVGVQVTKGKCNVQTVSMNARLIRG